MKFNLSLILLILLNLSSGYLIGRLTTQVEAVYNAPSFEFTEDINKKVPVVTIHSITNNILEGEVDGNDVRILAGDNIFVPGESNVFKIDMGNLINVIPVQIPKGMYYVASKRGKKVYSVYSKSGEKIKPGNRIYFRTKEEAKERGYKE